MEAKTIIAEGKTTAEAINNGLKQLHTTKEHVDIRVLEEENKKMFYSILAPRVVKVEMTLKEGTEHNHKEDERAHVVREKKVVKLSADEQERAKQNLTEFLNDLSKYFEGDTSFEITPTEEAINVEILNKNIGFLIGYRGETLYAFQDILSSVASRGNNCYIKVLLDIENYKSKRIQTLESLAERMAKTVLRTRRDVRLEPMKAFERKIIHTKLQEYDRIDTHSIGEEPHRRIVISLKRR